MLSKVVKNNVLFGTRAIQNFALCNEFDIVQDNNNGYLLIKNKSEIYIFNYYTNCKYNHHRIKLEFNGKYFFKQIESFDQNNVKQSKIIRKSVLSHIRSFAHSDAIIGIGGEYYIYFPFFSYDKYYGISNHSSIVSDANYNYKYLKSENYLVDYNKLNSYPKLNDGLSFDAIINVVNIHENIIKYICSYNVNNIIIITCVPLDKKIIMLNKYLKLKKITHVKNINSIITICQFVKL
jgi:hypothetical protein